MINFKANYIQSILIKENINNKLIDKPVGFVELSPQNKDDLYLMKNVSSSWQDGETFAENIYRDAYIDFWSPVKNKHYYAISEQTNLNEKLKASKILGLAEVQNKSEKLSEIILLQVNPKFNYGVINTKYKKIGTALLNGIKKLFPNHNFTLQSSLEAKKFYLKNGFEFIKNSCSKMIFNR